MSCLQNRLRVRVSASVNAVPALRREVVAAVIDDGDDQRLRTDVALVASELVSNAVRHAYPQAAGDVEVEAWRSGHSIRLVVRDWGRGPTHDSAPGLGLTIVDRVAASLEMRRSDCVEAEAWLDA